MLPVEDPTVTQFAVTGDLADLSQFDADKLADDFSAGPWNKLQYGGKPYALPIDSGPEMFFYNDAVFKKAGVDGTQIKTWDDYYEAAKKVRAIGSYMTNNSGSSMEYQPFTAQAWQAGAQPWKVDGENLTIDMTKDSGMKKYIEFQQKLIDEDLIDTKTANWSDDWNRELNDGTIASLTIGGWMPINLMNGAPDQTGNWRVAQLPQWEEGEEASAEDGGSALAVVSQSKQQAAAYKFVEYLTHGEGAKTMADTGTFPSLKSILTSEDFTDPTTEANKKVNDYFGGQNVNEVLSEAAQRKVSEFSYLPYNPFAQSSFGDQISSLLLSGEALWLLPGVRLLDADIAADDIQIFVFVDVLALFTADGAARVFRLFAVGVASALHVLDDGMIRQVVAHSASPAFAM